MQTYHNKMCVLKSTNKFIDIESRIHNPILKNIENRWRQKMFLFLWLNFFFVLNVRDIEWPLVNNIQMKTTSNVCAESLQYVKQFTVHIAIENSHFDYTDNVIEYLLQPVMPCIHIHITRQSTYNFCKHLSSVLRRKLYATWSKILIYSYGAKLKLSQWFNSLSMRVSFVIAANPLNYLKMFRWPNEKR